MYTCSQHMYNIICIRVKVHITNMCSQHMYICIKVSVHGLNCIEGFIAMTTFTLVSLVPQPPHEVPAVVTPSHHANVTVELEREREGEREREREKIR